MSGRRQQRYGVLIGPHDGDIDAIIDVFPDEIKEVVGSDNVTPYDVFFTVEVPSYDASKELAQLNGGLSYNNHLVHFAMTDIGSFPTFGLAIWSRVAEFLDGEKFHFCNWPSIFKITWRSPQHISTALMLTALWSMQNNQPIKYLNFSCFSGHSDFNLHGLRDWKTFFPGLTGINLSGNNIRDFEKMSWIFGDLPVIVDEPEAFGAAGSFAPELMCGGSEIPPEHFYDHWIMEGAVCPQFAMQYEEAVEPAQQGFDMFPVMQIDSEASILHEFICHYFESMWESVEYTAHLYSECSVFSLSMDPTSDDPMILEYRNVVANCKIGQYTRCVGREEIEQGMQVLFPNGFRASPAGMEFRELIPNMFGVCLDGVFEHAGGGMLGFRKSMVIGYADGVVEIMNDHMHVHSL